MGECKTGVYCIRNKVNGKRYVGGAYVSLKERTHGHALNLRKGIHQNRHLQAAWNKYGADVFVFEVLERCQPDDVKDTEQKWIDYYGVTDQKIGYNKSPTAGSCLGYRLSDEAKRRKSVVMKNSPAAIAQRKRLAESNRGRKMSETELANRSRAQRASPKCRGYKLREETKAKMSAARTGMKMPWVSERMRGNTYAKALRGRPGKRHTAETREKMKLTNKGKGKKGVVRTPEMKARTAESARKQWSDPTARAEMSRIKNEQYRDRPELRERIAQSLRGRKQSEETIAKRAASIRATCKKRREEGGG